MVFSPKRKYSLLVRGENGVVLFRSDGKKLNEILEPLERDIGALADIGKVEIYLRAKEKGEERILVLKNVERIEVR